MKFLGESVRAKRLLDSISSEDAYQFRKWLDNRRIRKTTTGGPKGQPMLENGKRKHIDNAKVFFNAALRRADRQESVRPSRFQHEKESRSRPLRLPCRDGADHRRLSG
ncbi:MAG: hypothetical protein R3C19_05140 [Planctomycetaceae bacterium]